MRVNVYAEEMSNPVVVRLVKKQAANRAEYFGLRFYLKSPSPLSYETCSAVTFWSLSLDALWALEASVFRELKDGYRSAVDEVE